MNLGIFSQKQCPVHPFTALEDEQSLNASVPFIKQSSTEGTVLFFNNFFFRKKDFVGLPIGKDNMLFTPHYALSYSVHPVRQTENVLTYNLAKSTLYLHRGTFARVLSVQKSINLSYLSTLQMSNAVNVAGLN